MPRRRLADEAIAKLLVSSFAGVRVFHAARPADPQSYYRTGLQLANYVEQETIARRIFLNERFPEVSESRLAAAIAELTNFDNHRAFVSLDSTDFLESAGHYLIYGSEYLCSIAALLGGVRLQQELKRHGRPTIFQLTLPFDFVSDSDLGELADVVGRELAGVRRGRLPLPIDFTFRLNRPLPPECVLAHEHPQRIIDPLQGFVPYIVPRDTI